MIEMILFMMSCSKTELGKALGCSRTLVADMSTGQRKVTAKMMRKLSECSGIPLEVLEAFNSLPRERQSEVLAEYRDGVEKAMRGAGL